MSSSSRIIMDEEVYKVAQGQGNVEEIPLNTMGDVLFESRTAGVEMNTVLHVAAQHGNAGFIRQALKDDQLYNLLWEQNSQGETPLHVAAKFGQAEAVKALIDAHDHTENSYWKVRDRHGDTPLHMALRFRHQDTAILLVQRDVDLVSLDNKAGESPAYIAAYNLCERFLRTILDTKHYDQSSVSFSGPFGMTVFHPARNLNDDIMLTLMERRKGLLKNQDNKGKTVLHYAVEDNIEPMVDILLKADSSLGYLHDNDGMTPLHRASSMGSFAMVRAILELSRQSISVICDKGNNAGKTALHVAKMDVCFLKVCLRHTTMNALINVADNEGNTPLHLIMKHNPCHQDVADVLFEVVGINWMLTNNDGCTPMDLFESYNKTPSTNLVSREEVGGINVKLENTDESDDNIPSNWKRFRSEYRRVNGVVNTHTINISLDQLIDQPETKWEEVFMRYLTRNGDSAVHIAAKEGILRVINKACELNCESRLKLLSAENLKAETPLHVAAAAGELEAVKAIINLSKSTDRLGNTKKAQQTHPPEQDEDEDDNTGSEWEYWKPWRMKSAKGDTPAHMALRNGHQQVAICLFDCDPQLIYSSVNKLNESLLYLAASTGCFDAMNLLLHDYNAIISSNGPHGQSALHALVRHLQDYSIKEMVNAPFDFKNPIVVESNQLCTIIAQFLVDDRNTNILSYVDKNGKTPLHYVVEHGLPHMVTPLLVQDTDGSTALMYDNEGFTPLLRAVANGYENCARIILEMCPASIELRHARTGRTVLHLSKVSSKKAPSYCSPRLEKLINETDEDGNTPLHCAVLESDIDKTHYLLSVKGVKLSIQNKHNHNHTPLRLCKQLSKKGSETHSKLVVIQIALQDAIDTENKRPSQVPMLLRINARALSHSGLVNSSDAESEKVLANLPVVASLLLAMTFAATFTPPGGYDQNNGQILGMKKTSMKLFVASCVVSALLSFGILLIYTSGAAKEVWKRVLFTPCVVMLHGAIWAALFCYTSGVFTLVSPDTKWIALMAVAILCGVVGLFLVTPAAAQILIPVSKRLRYACRVLLALLLNTTYFVAKIFGKEDLWQTRFATFDNEAQVPDTQNVFVV